MLRTQVRPLTLMEAVREKVLQANSQMALRFTTMDAMVNQSMTTERFRAALVSSFAAVGLLLAALGVYGTMAYSVAQRTFEIGIRMAFGAEKGGILLAILQQAALLAGCGIVMGLVLSLALARLITSMLVGVRPLDPATHVEPMVAFRAE